MVPEFIPSKEETALVDKLFSNGTPNQLGILTGDVALELFSKTKLSVETLSDIWSIADTTGKGSLSPQEAAVALRLTGWAQVGVKPTLELLGKPGPLAYIPDAANAEAEPNASLVPPFTPEDKAKFRRLFLSNGPIDGRIAGDKALEIFNKSKLPTEKLAQIWDLSDTEHRGALDATDFAIAMHLIQWLMNSSKSASLPASLPAWLYEQAAAEPSSPISPSPIATSPNKQHLAVQSPVKEDISKSPSTSSRNSLPQSPTATSPYKQHLTVPTPVNEGTSRSPSASSRGSTSPSWDIPPDVRANANRQFDALDPLKYGFIHDNISLPFLLESKLPPNDFAKIWNLADLNGDGKLTRDGFAIAFYLIDQRRQGNPLPESLSSSLNPPESHGSPENPSQPGSSSPSSYLKPPDTNNGWPWVPLPPPPPFEPVNNVPPPPPFSPLDRLGRRAEKQPEFRYPPDKNFNAHQPPSYMNESARPRASTFASSTFPSQPSHVRFSSVWQPDVKSNFSVPPPFPPLQDAAVAQLTSQLQEMQKMITELRLANNEQATAMSTLRQENVSLRAVIEELQVQVTSNDPASQKTVNQVLVKENEGLRTAVDELQQELRQLQASSSDAEMQRIQYDDLLRENERLTAQVQEMRESTTQLPWSGGDSELQTLINEEFARENARLRTEAREMQENVAELQEATAGYEEQRRVNTELVRDNERLTAEAAARQTRSDAQRREVRQLTREVERLKAQLQASATAAGPSRSSNDADVPPPAYNELDASLT